MHQERFLVVALLIPQMSNQPSVAKNQEPGNESGLLVIPVGICLLKITA
jgi:hypothetical protein